MSPRRAERVHGRILRAWTEDAGATLAADANPGATVLTVDDVSPFNDDGEGGWVKVGDQVVAYTTVDDDTATITLTDPVATLVEEDEYVAVWNHLYGEVDSVQRVHVVVDGHEDNTDHLEAVVADTIEGLPNGDRGAPAEGCVLERDGDEWELVRVKGRPAKAAGGQRWEADDVYVLTAADVTAGTATCPLSHRPIDESVDARWRTTPQEPTEYTVNYDARTVTWPLAGFEQAGDRLWFHYTYRAGIDRATTVHVGYESTGWKYLQVASTDSTDRSAPGFDDSGWSTGAAAFGTPNSGSTWDNSSAKAFGWPPSNTPWATSTALWLRRTVGPIDGTEVFVQVRVDNQADIYWNGTFVASSGELTESVLVEIPRGLLDDVNVLAVRANDLGTVSYLDCRVESR